MRGAHAFDSPIGKLSFLAISGFRDWLLPEREWDFHFLKSRFPLLIGARATLTRLLGRARIRRLPLPLEGRGDEWYALLAFWIMYFGCWNIRGLNDPLKQGEIRK
jgi:hypothetical protein